MKLTKEDIGKSFMRRNDGHQKFRIFTLMVVNSPHSPAGAVCGIGETDDGRIFGSSHGWDNVDWEPYQSENDTEFFDFRRFGCNEVHVRDLVAELDKRYVLKEKQ